MKKLLFATVSVIAISATSAYAADMAARPYTKAPMMAPVYDWSGFYVGANGGWGSSETRWSVGGNLDSSFSATGGVAGAQFGWRTQAGSLVWGFDIQGDWANLTGSGASALFTGLINNTNVQNFGIIAATAGYAVNNVLLYAKAGGAWTGNKFFGTVFLVDASNETRWGGALGAGLEYGLTANWTIGIEYDHLFMGAVNDVFLTPNGINTGTERVSQDVDLITARINYKFGGPVVARY